MFINVQLFTTFVHKMTTILNSGFERVIKLFYEHRNESLHLREIARKTNLYGQSVTRYLDKLEKEGIIKSSREGNLKKYSIARAGKTYSLFTLFDIEKLDKLPSIRKEAIRKYLEKLPERPAIAVLFGSTAKGGFREGSDIDILLITNNKIKTEKAENAADAQTSIKITSFQMTYEDFIDEIKLKKDPVVQSAITTGYPVANHIAYYEALYERL